MEKNTALSILLITMQLLIGCTIHEPFSGEPLVCFKKKCRTKKIIARRISKTRASIRKSRFHVNGKIHSATIKKLITEKSIDTSFAESYSAGISNTNAIPDTTTIIVQFDFESYQLTKTDQMKLADVENQINILEYSTIYIHGHTDNVGPEEYNQSLSEKRAALVRSFFIETGISSEKLKVIGHGSHVPLTSNETEAGRKLNRRVEFKIVSKI